MIRSTWTGLVPADFGTYTVFDPAPAWDHGLPTDGFDRATVNGFIGQGAPWAALIICGTRYGPVRLTVEVHDSPVDVEGEWTEIVECQFVPARRTSKGAEIEAALDVLAPRTVVMLSPQGLNHRPRPSTRLRRGAHNNEHGIQDQVPLTAGVVTRALRRASSRERHLAPLRVISAASDRSKTSIGCHGEEDTLFSERMDASFRTPTHLVLFQTDVSGVDAERNCNRTLRQSVEHGRQSLNGVHVCRFS